MSTIVTYMFIIMILALLIGFFLGWILRRSTYKHKYERKIDELMLREDNIITQHHINSAKLENNLSLLNQTTNNIETQKSILTDYLDQNTTLSNDIDNLQTKETTITDNISQLENEINKSSNELKILVSNSDTILGSKDQIEGYKTKIEEKNIEIDSTNQIISELEGDKETLNQQVTDLKKDILATEQSLNEQDKQTQDIINQFQTKTTNIMDDIESIKYKALNYKYAVKYINEKLTADEKITFETVDKIINKNEETSLFANIVNKLFGKSAKYIKGEK